jgi:transcriptional regulator
MPRNFIDAVQGTLDFVILKRLSWGEMHGYGIVHWIRESSAGELIVEEGTLYPALHRLEDRGLIEAEWGVSENNRRAKFYRLTAAGRRAYETQASGWERLSGAVSRAVTATELPGGAAG